MIEAQLSEAVTQLHLTAVETLNRLLKSETDPAELRRLLTIAVRVRHPAAERQPRASAAAPPRDGESAASAAPQAAATSTARQEAHHRSAKLAREERRVFDSSAPNPTDRVPQSNAQPPHSSPLSGRDP